MKLVSVVQLIILILSICQFSTQQANEQQEVIQVVPSLKKPSLVIMFENLLDRDHDGRISFDDYYQYLKELNWDDIIEPSWAKPTFEYYDKDQNGFIDLQEFLSICPDLLSTGVELGPREVHISLTNSSNVMQVMWVTPHENLTSPVVFYGEKMDDLVNNIKGTWHTYNVGHLGFHGRIYVAYMRNLNPKTKYYYKVGDLLTQQYSKKFDFYSPPNQQDCLQDKLDFAVYGDEGTIVPFSYEISKLMAKDNARWHYNFSLLAGDVAYAGTGNEQQGEIEPIWDLYGDQIQAWAAYTPFMPGLGNHEKYYNYTAYINRYIMPSSLNSQGNFWFSFDYGYLHVVHMSTEHDYSVGSPQYNFILQDLQAASTNPLTKWIIFGGHRPFYSSDADEQDQHWPGSPLLTTFESMLNQYKVDLVVNGHMHVYERMYQVLNGTVVHTQGSSNNVYQDPITPIYVVQGTAGALIRDKWIQPQPEWSASREKKYGYGRVQIHSNGTLHYQYIVWTAIGGEVRDEFFINKQL